MHPAVRKTLYSLRLRKIFSAVFVKVNAGVIEKLQRVEPYVTYGYEAQSFGFLVCCHSFIGLFVI